MAANLWLESPSAGRQVEVLTRDAEKVVHDGEPIIDSPVMRLPSLGELAVITRHFGLTRGHVKSGCCNFCDGMLRL